MTNKMTNQTQHMEDLIRRLQDLEENLKLEVPEVPIDPSFAFLSRNHSNDIYVHKYLFV